MSSARVTADVRPANSAGSSPWRAAVAAAVGVVVASARPRSDLSRRLSSAAVAAVQR